MNNLLQQIVAGAEAGSYYALIGLAIVVVMKSTDVPNFAQAEMGLLAAYMCWWLADGGRSWASHCVVNGNPASFWMI